MYDVAIIGAGPAGATAARLIAAQRRRVLLLDPRSLDAAYADGMPAKPCGGLLAPAAQKELARQGLGVPGRVTVGPQLFAVSTRDRTADIERLYQRHYVNIDRESFDRWLLSLVPDDVDARFGWVLESAIAEEQGVTLRCRTGQGTRVTARARLLVGADGAASVVRHAMCSASRPTRYVAIQGTFSSGSGAAHYGAFFDDAVTDFYGWTVPKGDTTLAGVAVPAGPGAPARYDRFIAALSADGALPGYELGRASAPVCRPAHVSELRLTAERTVLLGEAAGLISPSSAEGISYALRSGATLAHSLEQGMEGAETRYRDAALPLVAEVAMKVIKGRVIHAPAARRLIMRLGIGAIPAEGLGGLSGTLGELLMP